MGTESGDKQGAPLILVTNDDGYLAEGVRQLADALGALGRVVVVAPERERSAVSQSISLHKPLRMKKWAEGRWWCSGTPTDSVYLAIHHLLEERPDLVVSGINNGYNLADDVQYSGTVGAAKEAVLQGIPALAVSHEAGRRISWRASAELSVRVASDILREGLPERTLLNLNVPSGWETSDAVRVTRLGRRDYLREVTKSEDPRGREYFWLGGPRLGHFTVEGSDCDAVEEGVASLCPIELDLSAIELHERIRSWTSVGGGAGGPGSVES